MMVMHNENTRLAASAEHFEATAVCRTRYFNAKREESA
jgi:hypothetical protein